MNFPQGLQCGILERHGEGFETSPVPNRNASRGDSIMADKGLPSPEVLRQLLRYEPDTGKLFWLRRGAEWFSPGGRTSSEHAARTWNAKHAGREALTCRKKFGHLAGTLFDREVKAHRVVWCIIHGEWPTGYIDHINHDPSDNRPENLRLVNEKDNAKNRSANRQKASGLPHGVRLKVNKTCIRYAAVIGINGKQKHLGYFDTPELASAAYRSAAAKYNFHPNHGAVLRAKMGISSPETA